MAINLIDSQTPVDVVALLRLAEAYLAMHIDNHTLQIASAQSAIAYFRKADDRLNLMRALTIAGNALFDLGRVDEARAVLEESLDIARVTGSRWHIAFVSRNLGACLDTVDVIASRTYLTEALQLLEALDDQGDIEAAAIDFASLAFNEGDPELAVRHIAELFINGREPHSRQIAVLARVSVSQYLIALGRYEEAQEYARDALAAAREEHFDVYAAHSLGRLATIAALRATSATPDAHASAARILGFVEARLKTLGSAAQDHEPMAALLRKAIGTNTLKKLMAEGAAMTEEEAVEAAISL
jgi:tetratricopeptide (TPR) repeat protein